MQRENISKYPRSEKEKLSHDKEGLIGEGRDYTFILFHLRLITSESIGYKLQKNSSWMKFKGLTIPHARNSQEGMFPGLGNSVTQGS